MASESAVLTGKPDEKRNFSVLAIDDDDVDLESLHRNLKACQGYTFSFNGYRSWELGLDALAERPFDVIFLDFFLGNTTGTDLLQELRERGDMRPVIMLTGRGDEETAAESMRFGASDYIAKSRLSPDVLIRAIETARREYHLRMENAYLEQELRAARHLEAIGTLAGGVAHDFNNFLAGILASAELAQTYEPESRVMQELSRITGIVKNASDVIRRLLQFNKFYASNGEIGSINVHEAIRDTFQILEHSCPKSIQMHLGYESGPPPYIVGSSAKMHQILLNLCVNAIEAMGNEGRLTVGVGRVTLDRVDATDHPGVPAGSHVIVTVSDTGPGIPDDVRERMFDPFFTTKNLGSQKGTGLGLSTVWDCVRDMKGTIRVHSRPSHGTVFRVYLPESDAPPLAPAEREPELLHGTETILLVDDESAIRLTTAGLLRRLGYTVHCGESGKEALGLLQAFGKEIDIVVMDVSMPGMDGKEALRLMRSTGFQVPVLMATGHSAQSECEKVRALGAAGVVQKPFSIKNLAAQIRRALQPPAGSTEST
jgi:signal transduction histidine kinase